MQSLISEFRVVGTSENPGGGEMSWGPENHSMSPPGCRPQFLKPKLHKQSKNGFKPSKKWNLLLIFEFLCQYMCISTKKIDCRTSRICWKITKILKTRLFFHALCTFILYQKSGKMGPFVDCPIFMTIYVHKWNQFLRIWLQDFQDLLENLTKC